MSELLIIYHSNELPSRQRGRCEAWHVILYELELIGVQIIPLYQRQHILDVNPRLLRDGSLVPTNRRDGFPLPPRLQHSSGGIVFHIWVTILTAGRRGGGGGGDVTSLTPWTKRRKCESVVREITNFTHVYQVRRGGLVVSTLDYGFWGREFKSHRGQELLTPKKAASESTQL